MSPEHNYAQIGREIAELIGKAKNDTCWEDVTALIAQKLGVNWESPETIEGLADAIVAALGSEPPGAGLPLHAIRFEDISWINQNVQPDTQRGAYSESAWRCGAAASGSDGHTVESLCELLAPLPDLRTTAVAKYGAGAALLFLQQCWQVAPSLAIRLTKCIESSDTQQQSLIRDFDCSLRLLTAVHLHITPDLVASVESAGVPYVLLKGSATRHMAYSSPFERASCDIDIGAYKDDTAQLRDIAEKAGFSPAQWDETRKRYFSANPMLRALVEAKHYELGYLVKRFVIEDMPSTVEESLRRYIKWAPGYTWHLTDDDRVACYVSFDIHHGISLDVSVTDVVDTRVRFNSTIGEIFVPDLKWTLFHLIFKIYWEGVHDYKDGLYQFADLNRLLAIADQEVLEGLGSLLNTYSLEAAAFYVLRRTKIPHDKVPTVARLIEQYRFPTPGRRPIQQNDYGDMWPKLLGRR